MTSPLPQWPVDTTCLPDVSSDDPSLGALDDATQMAAAVLWALSGRQFGLTETRVRPCPSWGAFRVRLYPPTYQIFSWSDGWTFTGCGCGGGCNLSGPAMVHLPGPVAEVYEVEIAGEELSPTEYALEGNILYRVGGKYWPCQDMGRPLGEANTWAVTYLRGQAVPPGVGRLTAQLATEFYNACTGGKCRLPRTVTEVSRQGVTHRVVNPAEIYATGKTGIPEVDMWLAAVNPNHLQTAPQVL